MSLIINSTNIKRNIMQVHRIRMFLQKEFHPNYEVRRIQYIFSLLLPLFFPLKSAFCDGKNGIRNDFLHKNNKIFFASHKYAIKVWKTLAFSKIFNLFNHIKSALNPSDIPWAATKCTTEIRIPILVSVQFKN